MGVRASRIGVANPTSSLWRPGGRRPGHPRHRTVRDDRRPAAGPARTARGGRRSGSPRSSPTPSWSPWRCMQALLGFTSEARWLRYARAHLRGLFPYLPKQPGYNKRLRAAGPLIRQVIAHLATRPRVDRRRLGRRLHPGGVRAFPETAKRSDLAGWADYGYCASHSRCFWGLRLHLVCTLHGLPVGVRPGRREGRRTPDPAGHPGRRPRPVAARPGQTLIADKNYYGRAVRSRPRRRRRRRCCARPARARNPGRGTCSSTVAAGHRVGQRDLQGPARPRTPRRPHPRRRLRPGPATHPRPDRRDLAQRPYRPADPAIPDRLRPLTPWNQSSRRGREWKTEDLCTVGKYSLSAAAERKTP